MSMGRYFSMMIIAVGFLPAMTAAQEAPEFEAFADARQVLVNGFFEVTFTLRNGNGSNFQPPAFKDFIVASGPSRSVSTTIINGQVSKEMSYTYSLKPRKTGRFTIGPASVDVDGKTLRTKALRIEVIAGKKDGSSNEKPQFMVQAEPSTKSAYIGQQISLDYKLYTTINIESYNLLEESDYPGFYAEDLKRFDSRVTREIVGGVQYTTKVLKRIALFPQQAGALTLEPLQLQLGVVTDDARRPNSFFFNRQIQRLMAQTEPVVLNVLTLPAGAPESFSGAVGQFTMTSSINRSTLTTDDIVTIRVTITGNGDIKRVQPPNLKLPPSFELYEPKVVDERTYETNGSLEGKKVIEYLALPREAGEYRIRPVFTFFDPDSASYRTIGEMEYALTIRPGSRRPASAPIISDDDLAAADQDIRYLKTNIKLHKQRGYFVGSPVFWTLTALPFFLLGGVVFLRRIQDRQRNIDPLLLRSRQARKAALKRLEQAKVFMEKSQSRSFYDEISKAMLGYVGDKLRIPRSTMTKDNVQQKLTELQVSETNIQQFLQIVQNCEMALFAGKDNAGAMSQTYQDTLEVLTAIEASQEKD